MSKYKKMFVEEAREHLSAGGQHLVALEKAPHDKELINELFRNAHSIKGMAASLGFDGITELAHTLEDLLELCRSDKRLVDPPTIDLLLRSVDSLDHMVGEVEADRPVADASELCAEIQALISKGEPLREASPDPSEAAEIDSGESGAGPASTAPLRVTFRVAHDSVSPGARGFLAVRTLNNLGEIKNLRPEIGVIKSGRYGRVVDVELESDRAPEEIARTLGAIPEILEVRVQSASDRGGSAAASEEGSTGAPAPVPAVAAGQSSTVRVKTETLDRFVDAVGELILNKSELREIARELESEALHDGLSRLEGSLEELKRQAMSIRLTPLQRIFAPLHRLVRDLARSRGKQVQLEVRGEALELDRAVVDSLNDPLIHLVRNAVDHGVESPKDRAWAGKEPEGRILVEAYREKDFAVIHVEDNGRGIDGTKVREASVARGLVRADEIASLDEDATLSLLFRPGVSTASEVSSISGRGVGLDAVKRSLQGLGGSVSIASRSGEGTQFTLQIPFSAAILRALIVRVGDEVFAVPIPKVHRALELNGTALLSGEHASGAVCFCRVGEDLLPAWPLAGLLGFAEDERHGITPSDVYGVIVTDIREGRAAVLVDGLVGEEEVFVKPLGQPLSGLDSLSGITVLGSGRPVFVLDPYGLGSDYHRGALEAGDHEERIGE